VIPLNALVIYKNHPALVTETGDKIGILLGDGGKFRVREKDIALLHPGPVKDFPGSFGKTGPENAPEAGVREAWELLAGSAVSLGELAELAYGAFTPETAWAAYELLLEGLYFTGTVDSLSPRPAGEVAAEEQRRAEKQRDTGERNAFLARLRAGSVNLAGEEPESAGQIRRFLQDVEALGWGKTEKSRTLRELGRAETPQEAHRLLLETGVWTVRVNPHPARFGLSLSSARIVPEPPPAGEDRLDLTHLTALAIDNPWSADPDDAVSLECPDRGRRVLWVHVADPAAAVKPGSPADLEARGRGATLYLPEGSCRMLAEETLPLYALGLSGVSPALSFKLTLDEDGSIAETDILRSRIRVTRMSYEEADAAVADADAVAAAVGAGDAGAGKGGAGAVLAELFRAAEDNLARRLAAGAVSIELPETHIAVSGDQVTVEPAGTWRSADMIRECMLLAGEGAARWASRNRLPFPYVGQEAEDLPKNPPPGLAGFYQIRRCMRPRTLSVKPETHQGLGLDAYTQVTSPLRRYTDLLAHQQIRAFLRGEKPLTGEDVLMALAAGEAAAAAAARAERASRTHWTAVYLADKPGSPWEGVAVEKKGPRTVVLIPALGIETQTAVIKKETELNEPVQLILSSVRIPEGEFTFIPA
jgi:exoribonuclease-2